MDTLIKSPIEKFPIGFNFSNDLLSSEAISTKTVTCINSATGLTSKTTIIDSEAISEQEVRVVLKAGTEGDEHSIQCAIATSNGNVYQRDLIVYIQNVIDDSFTKQPDDSFLFDVDYTRRLESGDVVASAAVSSILESDGTAASVYNAPSVITPKIGVPVYGGVDGKTYRFGVRGTTNMGYIYEKLIRMSVQEF
jgi:hypothetical protein